MAHPPRGSAARGNRGAGNGATVNGRGSIRGGRGGSRGARGARGSSAVSSSTGTTNPVGMLQALRNQQQTKSQPAQTASTAASATTARGTARGTARQRGKGHVQWNDGSKKQFLGQLQRPSAQKDDSKSLSITKEEEQGKDRFEWLKEQRKRERAQGIADGVLHDPNKKLTLENAITPVGTCEDMCPEFERVERVQRHEVDRCEKMQPDDGGPLAPVAERMVKKFVRSDAGREEQLPSDIRTPDALVRTMDYLIEDVVGKHDWLIACHNFVWDRTRAIRNDFSIQQVSAESAVRMAVDCHERSARFLILSLHILSDESQLRPGDHFDAQQDVEQLNKTFTSLWHYYDSHRHAVSFPNEAEFRSYQILFEILSATPDLEDRMHLWPYEVLADARVQTALRLYQAANDTLRYRGPLRPFTPDMVAQMNACAFWDLLGSPSCSYLMACVAEISFYLVRFGFLAVLWKSVKKSPKGHQERVKQWTVAQMREYLSFDDDAQVVQFCSDLGIDFLGTNENGESYLDFARDPAVALELENAPRKQIFSNSLVETKRLHRNYVALINGKTTAEAIEAYEVVPDEEAAEQQAQVESEDEHSMFFPETVSAPATASPIFGNLQPQQPKEPKSAIAPAFGSGMFSSGLNPAAKPFEPPRFSPIADGKGAGISLSSPFGSGASAQPNSGSQTFNSLKFGSNTATFSTQNAPSVGPSALFDSSAPFGSTQYLASKNIFNSRPEATTAVPTSVSSAASPTSSSVLPSQGSSSSGFVFNNPFATSSQPLQSPSQPQSTDAKAPTLLAAPTQTQPPNNSSASTTKPTSSFFRTNQNSLLAPATSSASMTFEFSKPFASPQQPTAEPALLKPASPSAQPSKPESSQPLQPFFSSSGSSAPEGKTQKDAPLAHTSKPAAPIFNFPAAQAQSASLSQTLDLTSTSQQSPAQSEVIATPLFNFQSPVSSPGQTPVPSQTRPSLSPQKPAFDLKQASPTQPTLSPTSPVKNSISALSTTPPASPPVSTAAQQQELIAHAARLAITQPKGLLHNFLEYTLEDILPSIFKQHFAELFAQTLARLKANFLRRKYGPIWRRLAYESSLNRRAAERRKRFAESLKIEADKKRKRDDDLHEILNAMEDSKRIKAEQERLKREAAEKAKRDKEESGIKSKENRPHLDEKKQQGSRVAVSNDLEPPVIAAPDPLRHHKRARSSGALISSPHRSSRPAPPSDFKTSIFSAGNSSISQLERSRSRRESQRSQSHTQSEDKDNTRTDFFRLLAHDVDPETPLVSFTKAQIDAKAKKEKEERETRLRVIYNRRKVGLDTTATLPSLSPKPSQPLQPPQPKRVSTVSQTPSTRGSTPFDPDSDDLIRQIRETKKMLAEGSDWFKEQISTLHREEQEEEQEDRETSLPTSNSTYQTSAYVSTNGLHHSYLPGPSMSRAERLIRSYGLDKPKPKYGVDSFSARSSQRSISRSQGDPFDETATSGAGKRKWNPSLPDPRFDPGESEEEEEEGGEEEEEALDDTDELSEEDDEEDADQDSQHYYYHSANDSNPGKGGAFGTEGAYDDESVEDDEEEGYGQAQGNEYLSLHQNQYNRYHHPQLYAGDGDSGDGDGDGDDADAPTPGTQVSASGSGGPGATKEDAIALSDSD